MAKGFTFPVGNEPALNTSKRDPPSRLNRYSPKILRAELPVHRNRNLYRLFSIGLSLVISVGPEPSEQERGRDTTGDLRQDKAGCIRWANPRKRIAQATCDRYRRICKGRRRR